jgi:hypothetical protein
MEHKFTSLLELEVYVVAHVSPSVPPRPSSDPDSPAYSDPGDPGERSIEAVFLKTSTGRKIDITDCLSPDELEQLAEEAYDDAKEKFSDDV